MAIPGDDEPLKLKAEEKGRLQRMRRFMSEVRRRFCYGEKGFTLIELFIVVAILGIIAAVIIPNVSTFRVTGTLAAANSEASNVKTAAIGFYAREEVWPGSSGNLTPEFLSGSLRADYYFDIATGLIVHGDALIEDGWGDSVRWDRPGQKWVRNE